MRKIFLIGLLVLISMGVRAQALTNKIWDHRYGGPGSESATSFLQTFDNGFLVCGYSNSNIGFDKTDSLRGVADYWIVKTDNYGNILWDKTYGGPDWDNLTCVLALPDSGFLLGGYSFSDIGEDKSQALIGLIDIWVVRIDKNGNKIWDKTFGGLGTDYLNKMLLLPDGSYLLAGSTNSDSTVDMSHHSYGNIDYWILKIDNNGNKLWDINYGGTQSDYLSSICITSDHGFILGGYSNSIAGGCKSQNSINSYMDYWILKVDSNGGILWDKTFGGDFDDNLSCLLILANNNILFAGVSSSNAGFDKTYSNHGNSYTDYWIVCTDGLGNKIWDKVYGGNNDEDALNNISLFDSGILISGTSYSNISGDKSEDNIFSNEQSWIIAIDTNGNKLWDKTLPTSSHVESCYGIQIEDYCYTFLSFVYNNGGDVSQIRNSGWDYWFVKYCPSNIIISDYISSVNSLCQTNCIYFTNLSLNATSYQWLFPGGTPSSDTSANPQGICYNTSGTFDVTLIATNSNGSDTLTLPNYITVYPQIPFSALTQIGDTLFSIPGYTNYQWYFNSSLINGASDFYYVAPQSGNYSVVVTDSNGCNASAQMLNVIATLNDFLKSKDNFTIKYSDGNINLNINSSTTSASQINLTDALGNEIYRKNILIDEGKNEIELQGLNLSTGIYFIKIRRVDKELVQKFVVQ